MGQSNELTRRGLLRVGAGVVAAVGAAGLGQATASAAAAAKKVPIGLQVYSVRGEAQKDLAAVLAQVAEMGYEGVEFAGYYGWPAEKIRKVLDQHNLKCCGTHTGVKEMMGEQSAKTVEFNKTIGNKYLIAPSGMRTGSQESCIEFAKQLTELAAKAKEQGMRVGYHNHAGEFDGKNGFIPWEVFASNSSKDVILQVDIGHIARAGADPAVYMEKFPGRLTTVHVKDFRKGQPDPVVGEGEVDWPKMFRICEGAGGTEWYIIEDESRDNVMQRVKMDIENLRKLLAKYHA
ncbi:MAG: sugar phosphate isomerase/epimerase [Sedimentisphaerales bacterium]|nr:sugar phosphate isomerase/epimerase [Sedimentisphaerales bacterium]